MTRLLLVLAVILACSRLWPGVYSQSPADCIFNTTIQSQALITVIVASGVVCFTCDYGNGMVTDATFQINLISVSSVGGILVVADSTVTFERAGAPHNVLCADVTGSPTGYRATVFLRELHPPIISGDSTVNESGSLFLDCNPLASFPTPTVAWYGPQGGGPLTEARELRFPSVQRSMSGRYHCTASNDGNSETTFVNVTVQYPPDVLAVQTSRVDVPLGSTAQLSCTYDGVPAPSNVFWRHNAVVLNPLTNSNITVEHNDTATTLTRSNMPANGEGEYECVAANLVGQSQKRINVRVQLPSDPVTALEVVETTIGSLQIRWQNPSFTGHSPILNYRLLVIDLSNGNNNVLRFGNGPTTSYNVTNLTPLRQYSLQLLVVNAVNLMGATATVMASTLSLRLGAVSANVNSPSSTEIRLIWKAPTRADVTTTAPTTSYEVVYREQNGEPPVSQNISAAADPNDDVILLLGELDKGTRYDVNITAFNIAGAGLLYSVPGGIETLVDPPTVPRDVVAMARDPFTIVLSWTTPVNVGGRSINQYTVLYVVAGAAQPLSQSVVEGPDERNTTLGDLEHNTTYQIMLSARNTKGLNSMTVTVNETTPPVGPAVPPSTTDVTNRTNTSAIIRWSPSDNYPVIYLVQYKRRINDWRSNTTSSISLTADNLWHTLTDLRPLTLYDVRVRSQNVNGDSLFGLEAVFRTFGMVTIKGPPQNETNSVGQSVTLTCSLEGAEEKTQYQWTRQSGADLPADSQQSGASLVLISPQEQDSDVYICSAESVSAEYSVTFVPEPSSRKGENISPVVIGVAVGVGGVALIIFLVVIMVTTCLCVGSRKGQDGVPHKRTYSFRPRHWAEASSGNTARREDAPKEHTQSFAIPKDYQGTSTFNTVDRVHPPSPSPAFDHPPPSYNGLTNQLYDDLPESTL